MIDKKLLETVLEKALSTGGDFSEIYVGERWDNSISLISGKIENSVSGTDFGVGIRVIKDLYDIYAYTNDASEDSLIKLAEEVANGIMGVNKGIKVILKEEKIENISNVKIFPNDVSKEKKIEVMKKANKAANDYSELITQVKVVYTDYTEDVLIANSSGQLIKDKRVRTRFTVQSVASKDGDMQTGNISPGAAAGFEFIEGLDVESIGREASRIAVTMVGAELCPSGQMPVVIDNGFGGVIFHEACGHGLEASSVAKKTSVFSGKLGQQVANSKVTAIDDGTIPNEWGTLNVDDEGRKPQKKILIEKGILKSYMVDILGGKRMKVESTGSGRRQSYAFAPTSRMTNTFIAPGEDSFEDMIKSVEKGLYAKYMGGGSVNTATGDFNFAVMEAYLIENGKITKPVKGATLIGNGPKILMEIDMVGTNFSNAAGMCGASSGTIPAAVGQPAIRVANITVGGRK
ncbi:MAG: TldD/PmbA family protein [Fusobacteriaceae bacterium]